MQVKVNERGFERLHHPATEPGGDERLVIQSHDVVPCLWIGQNHKLDRAEVEQLIKHLDTWVKTESLEV